MKRKIPYQETAMLLHHENLDPYLLAGVLMVLPNVFLIICDMKTVRIT